MPTQDSRFIVIRFDRARTRQLSVAAAFCAAVALPSYLFAADALQLLGSFQVPHTFHNGGAADANEMNANFDAVESAINGQAQAIAQTMADVTANSTGISNNQATIAGTVTSVSALSTGVADNQLAIAQTAATASGNATTLTAIAQSTSDNAAAISANVGAIGTNNGAIAGNAGAIDDNANVISGHATALANNAAAITANAAGVGSNAQAIATQGSSLATHASDIAANTQAIADLGDQAGGDDLFLRVCDAFLARGVVLENCSKRVFVSKERVTADFGGVEGADALCQGWADDAGLSGEYRAWISSTADNAPVHRFVRSDVPYLRVDGVRLADDWDDLIANHTQNPLSVDQFGDSVETCCSQELVWTNTREDGTLNNVDKSCQDWSSAASDGTTGLVGGHHIAANRRWTRFTANHCSRSARLLCFEQ